MNVAKINIIIYTRYKGGLNGGSIRHEQIVELLQKGGFDVVVNPGISPRFRSQIVPSVLSCIRIVIGNSLLFKRVFFQSRRKGGLVNLLLAGRSYHAARKSILKHQTQVVIVEDAIFGGQGAIFAAKELQTRVIAMPHNIDALTGRLFGIMHSCKCLAAEMETLSLADKTFTISQSDAWFHRQFGIYSTPLSYYPSTERESYLSSIRSMREGRTKEKRFLIAGSAQNLPTKEGMAELLGFIGAQSWPQDITFDVIGTETKSLWNPVMSKQIVFHSVVNTEQFLSLASKCAACIAYQKQGTGSLTRILDMLLAGVPVLGNAAAVRDWQHLDGVHLFSDWTSLMDLLNSDMSDPRPPSRSKWQEDQFFAEIRHLVKSQRNAAPL